VTAKTQICAYCGETFTPQRSTGKFCKPACRVAFRRAGFSGMTADDVETYRMSMESYYEKKRWDHDAQRVVEAEVARVRKEYAAATTPYDLEDRIEAVTRHFFEASCRWEPGCPAYSPRARRSRARPS
jgi:hypothetical protein